MTISQDDGDGRPTQRWSLTLKRWQMIVGLIAGVISILGAAAVAGRAAGNVYLDLEFDKRMDTFHERAIPEVREIIRAEVALAINGHEVEALESYNRDKLALASQLAALETHAGDTDHRLQRIEDMVWALYSSRFGNRPPPPSPNGH